jgi:myo-inositol-1(or 4)-monophosphatase
MMTIASHGTPLTFAANLARQAGQLLLEHYRLSGTATRLKADRSVVTEADLAADRFIAESIRAAYPQDGLVSEELQPVSPARMETVWVIDPLDGTTNFALGIPLWGVSIARLVDGFPDTAALYFPLTQELYTAQRGSGSFLNEGQIVVKPPVKGQINAFFACCSRTHQRYAVRVPYKTRILGSAAYNICSVGRGAAVLAFEATAKVWDLAAAWLVAAEAGGIVEPLHGPAPFPLEAGVDYRERSFPCLAAATPELAKKAHEQISPKNIVSE